jgi:RNA polymerase sigma factor for flagellar operon FliA
MLNRHPLPPPAVDARLQGSILLRPSARLLPAQLDTVIDVTTARPKLGSVGGDNGLRSEGSWDGPPGRPPRGPNGDATGDGPAADPLVDSESGSAVDAAVDAVGDVDTDVDEVAATAAESFEPVASIEESPNLSGYEAYGHTPAPGPRLSRDELVQKYAHLVKYVVGRLGVSVPGLFDHEDAMQAGVLGLLRAIDAYRPDAAASFESYAILRIRGAILDAVRSLDTVGRAGREAARAIQGAIRDLQHELGRSPNETEIATRLNMPITRYRERLQAASVVTISLDEHDSRDSDDESVALADSAPDPNAVDPADEAARRDAIASLIHEIGRLSERPRLVLSLYYQDEMTFKEIGQVLGVTESRVCQIHTEAILALRTRLVDPDVAARLGRRRARP